MKRSMRGTYCLLLILIVIMSSPGSAQEWDAAKTDSTLVKDSVEQSLSGAEINRLPVRTIQDILSLQSGTVELRPLDHQMPPIGQTREIINGQEVYSRGGRTYETRYIINGIDFTNKFSGLMTATVSPMAIDRVVINQRGFSLGGYGSPGSALVNISTKPGGERLRLTAEAVTDNGPGSGFDQNWYSFSASGPVGAIEGLTFSGTAERRWLGDRNPSIKTEEIIPADLAGSAPNRLPSNWQSGWSYHGRVDYELGSKTKISATYDGSHDTWQEYRHSWLFNSDHSPKYRDDNLGTRATISHRLFERLEATLSGSYFESERLSGDGVLFDDLAGYQRSYITPTGIEVRLVNPEFEDNWALFRTDSEDQLVSWIDTILIYNADSSLVIDTAYRDTSIVAVDGIYANYTHHKSSTWDVAGDLRFDLGNDRIVNAGIHFSKHNLRYYENLDASRGYSYLRVNRFGFDMNGNESDTLSYLNRAKRPSELSAYGQLSQRLSGLTFVGGVRFRSIDYKARELKSRLDPFGGDAILDEADLVWAKPYHRWEPYLKVSTNYSERSKFSFSFAQNYIVPPAALIYVGWNFLQERVTAGSYLPFGSARVEPLKATTVQVDFRTLLLDDKLGLKLTAYSRSTDRLPTIDQNPNTVPRTYAYYSSGSESKTDGVELKVWVRPTKNYRFDLGYTLQNAKGTSSDAYTNYINRWQGVAPQMQELAMDTDQRHKFVLQGDIMFGSKEGFRLAGFYPFERTHLSVVAKLQSGLPYTSTTVYDAVTAYAIFRQPTEEVNASRQSWQSTIDLKLERSVEFGGVDVTWFVWVKNLLNKTNVQQVWSATGEPDNSAWLETEAGQMAILYGGQPDETGFNFEDKYRLKESNPLYWGPPRQIYFGLRVAI